MASSKKIVIIYHGDCWDGFAAAYAAWKKFGSRAGYIAGHRDAPPQRIRNRRVYLLDFTYHDPELRLFQRTNLVTAIDHHGTTRKEVESTEDFRFDLDHSGCVLAWRYFHPGKKVPELFKYIEDLDIWALKLKGSRLVRSFLEQHPFDFKAWDKLVRNFERPAFRVQALRDGAILRAHAERIASRAIEETAERVNFLGYKVYAANVPHALVDEVGELLRRKHPPFAIMWRRRGDVLRVGLRGVGRPSVAKLAERFGGGGHPGSAAFSVPWKQGFPWKPVK